MGLHEAAAAAEAIRRALGTVVNAQLLMDGLDSMSCCTAPETVHT
ncbi:hypothetical protein [Azorhizobium oxalatiphilum]|nr:hypothetical protein [Azorhizobium oxalatiphilum]